MRYRYFRKADRNPPRDAAAKPSVSTPRQRWFWLLVTALFAYFTYLTFKAYLDPELLIGFANLFSC